MRANLEVAGLAWLGEAQSSGGALVVEVCGSGSSWIETAYIASVHPSAQMARNFGAALARTHAAGAPHFGAPPPGVFESQSQAVDATAGSNGTPAVTSERKPTKPIQYGWMGDAKLPYLMSPNTESAGAPQSWGAYYAKYRLLPYCDSPVFSGNDREVLMDLCDRLESGDLDHDQPTMVRENGFTAARCHGDLWSGNLLWSEQGGVLIDPAAQGSHAEEDLAQLALFGCSHLDSIYDGYNQASPLVAGWRTRIGLHQMHMLIIHAVLFGGSYVNQTIATARRYV